MKKFKIGLMYTIRESAKGRGLAKLGFRPLKKQG
jgi:hypothetical protein